MRVRNLGAYTLLIAFALFMISVVYCIVMEIDAADAPSLLDLFIT